MPRVGVADGRFDPQCIRRRLEHRSQTRDGGFIRRSQSDTRLRLHRPGTPVGEQASRSDPVRQPTTAAGAVADLHALLGAAHEAAPYVLVGHSYGGLIARLYARLYPEAAAGLVLVDALSEGLQEAETPNQWAVQRVLLEGDIRESLRLYPDLERIDPDRSFDELRAAPPLKPIPLVVLSADRLWGPQVPALIANGTLPADVPPGSAT